MVPTSQEIESTSGSKYNFFFFEVYGCMFREVEKKAELPGFGKDRKQDSMRDLSSGNSGKVSKRYF